MTGGLPETHPPPLVLRVAAGLVLLCGAAMILVGGWRLGATTDEPFQVERFNNYQQTGWFVTDYQVVDGRPGSGVEDQYVYGPATMSLLHVVGRAVGTDPAGSAGTSAGAYRTRHLAVGLIALLGVAAAGLITARILRGRFWGLVAAALLVALPTWTGYSMFDPKDVSVATGYTFVTLGLLLVVRQEAGRWWNRLAAPALLGSGTLLAVGTRPALWTTVLVSVVATILVQARAVSPSRGWRRWRLAEMTAGLVAAAVAMLALYPKVFSHPFTAMSRSADASATYLDLTASRLYLPAHVILEMPTLALALVLLGLTSVTVGVVRQLLSRSDVDAGPVLVSAQLLALPLASMVRGSALNSGLRQVMFAAPAAAIVATLGIAALLRWQQARQRRWARSILVATSVLALLGPTFDQATLFPYNYSYYSPTSVVSSRDIPNGDYYGASRREYLGSATVDRRVICNRYLAGSELPEFPVSTSDDDCPTLDPYLHRRDPAALAATSYWAVGLPAAGSNCTPEKTVSRWLRGTRYTLSRLYLCRRELPLLSPGGVDLTLSATEREALTAARMFLLAGWQHPSVNRPNPWGRGARAVGSSAYLAFRLPERGAGAAPGAVRLSFARPVSGLVVVVGHRQHATPGATTTVEVPLPRTSTIVMELRKADGSALDAILARIDTGQRS